LLDVEKNFAQRVFDDLEPSKLDDS
jgi:hypothetical protein